MKENKHKQWWENRARAYSRFMDKQGFYIVLCVCVMAITLSAVYTARLRDTLENPVLEQGAVLDSAVSKREEQNLEQALIASQTAPPAQQSQAPSQKTVRLARPVAGATLRGFSLSQPSYFKAVRMYAVHTGLDLIVQYGQIVTACEAGTVTSVEECAQMGLCVTVSHQAGLETRYCGLSATPYVRKGDTVRQGQTLGHAGNGVIAEAADEAHLHLEVRKNGDLVDPEAWLLQLTK